MFLQKAVARNPRRNSESLGGTKKVNLDVVVASAREEEKEARPRWKKEYGQFSPSTGDAGSTLSHGKWRAWGSQQDGLAWWDQPKI